MKKQELGSANCPVLYVGGPGTGKTAKIKASYDALVELYGPRLMPESLSGTAIPVTLEDSTAIERRLFPEELYNLYQDAKAGKSTAVFIDEIDKTHERVSDTLLSFIQDRKLGPVKLHPTTHIIAAANPPSNGGRVGRLSEPLLNRFCIRNWELTPEEWVAWAEKQPELQTPEIHSVLGGVLAGSIQMYDDVGTVSELTYRCNTPRSLHKALLLIAEGKVDWVDGLVTPSANTQIGYLVATSDSGTLEDIVDDTFGSVFK